MLENDEIRSYYYAKFLQCCLYDDDIYSNARKGNYDFYIFNSDFLAILINYVAIYVDMDYANDNNILSIKYILPIKLAFNLESIVKTLYFNYDVENKKVLSNSELLNNLGYNTLEISEYLLDNIILKDKEMEDKVIDSLSNNEMTIKDIINNKEEYINRINDKLINLNFYVNKDNISIEYFNDDLINICYVYDGENKYEITQYKKG